MPDLHIPIKVTTKATGTVTHKPAAKTEEKKEG
jgi:hypothetical protein